MVIDFLIAEMQLNSTVFMKLCLLLMALHHPDGHWSRGKAKDE